MQKGGNLVALFAFVQCEFQVFRRFAVCNVGGLLERVGYNNESVPLNAFGCDWRRRESGKPLFKLFVYFFRKGFRRRCQNRLRVRIVFGLCK